VERKWGERGKDGEGGRQWRGIRDGEEEDKRDGEKSGNERVCEREGVGR
jgi:hypothetical protein